MTDSDSSDYSKVPIRELIWNEAIRIRPGMYIGSVNNRGFMWMLRDMFSEAIRQTASNHIIIELKENFSASMTIKNVHAEIRDDWCVLLPKRETPVELGFQVANALSTSFRMSLLDAEGGEIMQQNFSAGELQSGEMSGQSYACQEVQFDFELDKDIWKEHFEWNNDYLLHEIKAFAYLYRSVKFDIDYLVDGEACHVVYHFKNGLKDRVDIEKLKGLGTCYFELAATKMLGDIEIELALMFRDYSVDESFLKSYVNDLYTSENGTHVDGMLKGLTYGVMKYFQKYDLTESYKISEKGMKEHLVAMIHVRLDRPLYSGCVRNKLANSEIIEPIAEYVADLLFNEIEKDQDATERLIEKFKIH